MSVISNFSKAVDNMAADTSGNLTFNNAMLNIRSHELGDPDPPRTTSPAKHARSSRMWVALPARLRRRNTHAATANVPSGNEGGRNGMCSIFGDGGGIGWHWRQEIGHFLANQPI